MTPPPEIIPVYGSMAFIGEMVPSSMIFVPALIPDHLLLSELKYSPHKVPSPSKSISKSGGQFTWALYKEAIITYLV
jgi:hypothetical protein